MLGFSVIGTPDGFKIISINDNKELPLNSLVDLDNNVISIFPNTDILKIVREVTKSYYRYYFVYYRFAYEIKETRQGCYYGSVVTITDRKVDFPACITNALIDLANVIKEKCLTEDNRFHRDIEGLEFNLPESLKELKDNLKKGDNFSLKGGKGKSGYFHIGEKFDFKNYKELIRQVLNDDLLSDYKILYASNFGDVYNDVLSKNRLDILTFSKLAEAKEQENRIEKLKLEQKRIDEQLRLEQEEKLRKEREEREALEKKRQSRLPTEKEIPVKVMNLESKSEDFESRLKRLENSTITVKRLENPDPKDGKIGLYQRISNKFDHISWQTVLYTIYRIIIDFAVIIFLVVLAYKSCGKVDNAVNQTTASSNQTVLNKQTPNKDNSNNISPNSNANKATDANKKFQIGYVGKTKFGNEYIKTVDDLIRKIKGTCVFCEGIDKEIIESIRSINTSINDGQGKQGKDFTDDEIRAFELSKIKGDVVFEVSCCNLPEIDKANFKLNK